MNQFEASLCLQMLPGILCLGRGANTTEQHTGGEHSRMASDDTLHAHIETARSCPKCWHRPCYMRRRRGRIMMTTYCWIAVIVASIAASPTRAFGQNVLPSPDADR